MIYTLFFSEDALGDIEESYKWYEEQKHGLGEDFLDSIYSGADKIRILLLPKVVELLKLIGMKIFLQEQELNLKPNYPLSNNL
jgi:hypothetical protein